MEDQLIHRIQNSINYIEDHLYEKLQIREIAKAAFMSQSSFYVAFSNILSTTVKDYIRKRRLSMSGHDLIKSDLSVLAIALKYQYNTYESYSRAFKKLFSDSPQKYRENNVYVDIFPRIFLTCSLLGENKLLVNREMNTEILAKKINDLSTGYILDIDIDHFQKVNDLYGYSLGDKVLIELPNRIKKILRDSKLDTDVIRINNDEFALIIKDRPKTYVEKLAENIINEASKPFTCDDLQVSITVSIGISTFTLGGNSVKAVENANNTMLLAKAHGRNQYKLLEEENSK